MSFPRYEKYKDSGVEWLGEVPEVWEVLAVWLLFELGRGRVISNGEILDNAGDYPVYSSQTENNGEMGKLNTYDFDGDYITWTTDGANAGTVFRRSGKFNCTNVCGTLKAKKETVLLNYCTHALSISTASFVRQDINPKLMNNVMATIKIPIPPFPEQQTIASFLDRETGKIDALVAEQERLIELLKEKRQAVISHAVTKGLDPDAPMKDSGIEWLGEVPEGWEVKRLKYLGEAQIGLTFDPSDIVNEGEGLLVLRSSNVQNGHIVFDDNVYVNKPVNEKLILKQRDILICSRNGSRALIGKNAMIDESSSGLTFGAFMTIFRSDFNKYLSWVFNSQLFEFQSGSFLTSTINQLTIGNLYSFEVLMPPQNEQTAIAAFLDTETAKIDTLITEAQQAMSLLKERRSALISAAVTGKIDVRQHAKEAKA